MKKYSAFYSFCIILSAILWGSIGVFVRQLNAAGLSSLEILQMRVIAGLLITGAYLLLFDRKAFFLHPKDLWCFLGTGVASLFCMAYFYYQGISLSSMAVMAGLLYTSPAFVMLLSRLFFKEKLTAAKLAAILLTVLGCILISGIGTTAPLSVTVLLYGLGSGFCYSLYSVFGRFAIERSYSSWTVTFYTMLFCTVCCAFFCDWRLLAGVVRADCSVLVWAIANGLVTAFGAYGLYTLGLSGMQTGKASVLAALEPVAATVFGIVFFAETASVRQLLGIAMVLAGVAVVELFSSRKANAKV